jgi:flavorubredoxin
MNARKIVEGVYWMGAVDWDRRLFDALIPLPDGTSYNAYLVRGSEKTALVDSVDPAMSETLLAQLQAVPRLDYVVANHAEQDHSGLIPTVLNKYPEAKLVCTPKCKGMLVDLLDAPIDRIQPAADGEKLSLGDKTLEFIHTPWVHWPETMSTYLPEDKILFSCDFFGAHLATTDLYACDEARVYEAAKRYYAEIMMPFRKVITRNLERVQKLDIAYIAPSHGPVYKRPEFILRAYQDWVNGEPKNAVVVPYVSMHHSTLAMVRHLVGALADRGIVAHQFDLAVTDLGRLAITLVDAGTLVLGTPVVHAGPHPAAAYALQLVNVLHPKLKYATVIGSYGWNGRAIERPAELLPNLKVEALPVVLCRGFPREADFRALDELAATIAAKHQAANLARVSP